MKKSLLVALALACAATAASADIIRVTVVQAANQDDFAFNDKITTDAVLGLIKKSNGGRAAYAYRDAKMMITGSVSLWPDEATAKSVMETPEWKAQVSEKLKIAQDGKAFTVQVFDNNKAQ
jgi:hypothetical protein